MTFGLQGTSEGCDLGLFNGELIFDEPIKLPPVKGCGITGGLAPDTLAAERTGDYANGPEQLDAHAFDIRDTTADDGMHEQEIDHEMMAPCAADHRTAEAGGKPVGGGFEVEALFTLRIGGDHALKRSLGVRDGIGVAIVPPAFGCQQGELARIHGPSHHGGIALQLTRHPPASG